MKYAHHVNSLKQKADDKIFVCKFSNNVKSMLYQIENSKTSGQTCRSTCDGSL